MSVIEKSDIAFCPLPFAFCFSKNVIQKETACVKTQESVTLSGVEGC
jgi:hypothetical protein